MIIKKEVRERRKHPRVALGITMDIAAAGHGAGKCRGAIADLSSGGMSFKSSAELEPGMCLHLKLDGPLQLRGEIRHASRAERGGLYRYGVRFHKVGYGQQAA